VVVKKQQFLFVDHTFVSAVLGKRRLHSSV